MGKENFSGRKVQELVGWVNRLTGDDYQNRRWWLEQLTSPNFNMDVLKDVLTPITFGPEIKPPFDGAILDQDGPGDEAFDIGQLKLVSVLNEADSQYISFEEAVRRGQANAKYNWGQRLAFRLRNAGNNGQISKEVWPVGQYLICSKTIWRCSGGDRCAWYVFRDGNGFYCHCLWFGDDVGRDGRFPSLGK